MRKKDSRANGSTRSGDTRKSNASCEPQCGHPYYKKRKVHPTTAHEGPEGEEMYSSTLSLTSALDWGGWSAPRPGRLTPEKGLVPIVQEAGWAPGPVWTGVENVGTHRDSIPGPSSR